MSRPWVRAATVAIVVVLALDVGVLTLRDDASSNSPSSWSRLGDIAYILPDDLPPDFVVFTATERLGRPQSEWTSHTEILATRDRRRYLVLSVNEPDVPGHHGVDSEPVGDVDPTNFVFLFAYTVAPNELELEDLHLDRLKGRGVVRASDNFIVSVVELSAAPNDPLVESVASQLAGVDDLDFSVPTRAREAGFVSVATSAAFPEDITDYTVAWGPQGLAGSDRSSRPAKNTGPILSINAGCRFYGQNRGDGTDPRTAPIERNDEGVMSLRFLLDGSPVSMTGRGVDERTLRAAATSLRAYERTAWRRQLGERLLIDRQDDG